MKLLLKHIKYILYCKRLKRMGVQIDKHAVVTNTTFLGTARITEYCRLIGSPKIIIGDDFYVNVGCHFLGDIEIGQNVMIGPKVIIGGRNHGMDIKTPMNKQPSVPKKVQIGDDVWIGAGAIILAGVSIGAGTVIGAGSVVTKSIPSYSVAVGNPAKIIKKRM